MLSATLLAGTQDALHHWLLLIDCITAFGQGLKLAHDSFKNSKLPLQIQCQAMQHHIILLFRLLTLFKTMLELWLQMLYSRQQNRLLSCLIACSHESMLQLVLCQPLQGCGGQTNQASCHEQRLRQLASMQLVLKGEPKLAEKSKMPRLCPCLQGSQ